MNQVNKNYKLQMQEEQMDVNHKFLVQIRKNLPYQQDEMQTHTPLEEGFEIDSKLLAHKINHVIHTKDSHHQVRSMENNAFQDHQKLSKQNQHLHEHQEYTDVLNSHQINSNPHLKNSSSKEHTFQVPASSHYHQQKLNQQQQSQKDSHSKNINLNEDEDEMKITEPVLTKRQIQEQTQHLNELKQKKKEQERKKIVQKMHLQQKQRLQKLKQQTRQYQEMKKLKDNEIMQYKNQLQSLQKNKAKQVFKQKQKLQMQQIQQQRQKQHKYFLAMMQEKQRRDHQMNRQNEIPKQRKLEKEQEKRREKQRLLIINSTTYQRSLREKKKKQEQEKKKIQEIKQFLLRRNSYQQKLRNLSNELMKQKPKPVKQKSQIQTKQQQRRLNTKSLSASEIYRMGQEFMEEVHSNIDQDLIEQSKINLSNVYNSLRESTRTQYKDYLREEKLQREKFFKSTGKLQANPQIRELRKLIVKEENSPQKLLKAKLLTQRFDSKVTTKSSLKLKADSIAAKLKVIQEFI